MKKWLYIALILFLIPAVSLAESAALTTDAPTQVTVTPIPSDSDKLNLLWDIPFGSTPEVFCKLVYDNTGLAFQKKNNRSYETKPEQQIKIAGVNALSVTSVFKPVESGLGLERIYIDFGEGKNADIIPMITKMMRLLYESMSQKYGSSTDYVFYDKPIIDGEPVYYSFPASQDSFDSELFELAFTQRLQENGYTVLQIDWNNINIGCMALSYKGDYSISLSLYANDSKATYDEHKISGDYVTVKQIVSSVDIGF